MTKQHIIEEIRRVSEANGGLPPGFKRFAQLTGISQSEWIGKIWARWGDALREAGYTANTLQPAFPDDYFLEKLACFVRELGRFPAQMEMRLRKRSDASFPNSKGYERFGTKAQLATRLVEYCRLHDGFDEVIKVCIPLVGDNKVPASEDLTTSEEEEGFVYLLRSGRYYKIGRSNAAGRRERELAIQLPEKAKTIHVIRTDDPVGIEAYWHLRFETKRVRKGAEWFDLDAEDVKAFKRRKFM